MCFISFPKLIIINSQQLTLLMTKIKAIIKLSRIDNFLITFFAVIVAAIIAKGETLDILEISAAAFAMAFACSAGNIINDIYDIEIDKINRPERMLPQKVISIETAKMIYVIYLILSITFAYYNGMESVIFLTAVNIVLFIYSTSIKNVVLVGNIVVSLLTMSALIYGAMIAGNTAAGIIPGVFAFFTNFIREIIKDIEDVEGDSANNVITFPNLKGIKKSIRLIHILTVILILLTTVPFLFRIYRIEYFILVMPVVNGLFVYMLRSLREDYSIKNMRRMSNLVKLIMIIGIIAIYLGNM